MKEILIIDSNIIIYASKPEYHYLRNFLDENKERSIVSAASMVETLSFNLTKSEKKFIESFFETTKVIAVDYNIIKKAKSFQEELKLKTGDAIIAATAIKNKGTLVTNNTTDFAKIKEIKLFNPVRK